MKRGVVFDMDKCIGYFTQIAMYQDIIEELSRPLLVKEYYELFDMFPTIFRPGIFNVFRYLVKMKKKGRLEVIMYTNNNGPPSWATNIRKYIEHKIKHKLFDRTIKGWKYNNKIVEDKRRGYEKSWEDLLDCTRLTKNDKVIFFDDRDEHYKMRHGNVDYQKVKPYRVGIEHDDFVNKFVKSKLNKRLKINREELIRECNRSRYNPRDTSGYSNNDIMKPLVKFMKINKNKTRRKVRKGKKTRKKIGGKVCRLKKKFPRAITLDQFLIHAQWVAFFQSLPTRAQNQVRDTIEEKRRDPSWSERSIKLFLQRFMCSVIAYRARNQNRTVPTQAILTDSEGEDDDDDDDDDGGGNNVGTQTV